jgi:hypothetical protein
MLRIQRVSGREWWQANCLEDEQQILVALKRNDAYALKHQSWTPLTICASKLNEKR